MQIDIVTLFPKMFSGIFEESIIGKAVDKKQVQINIHNLRDWAGGPHSQVDDRPFGGGEGMVLMIEPVFKCVESLKQQNSKVIALSAKGESLKQSRVNSLAQNSHIILLCGHYEGFDHRILQYISDLNISIGNFILTGGEIGAMALTEAIVRVLPGVLGNEKSIQTDSFFKDDKTIQYPQYTRPENFSPNETTSWKVPNVLLSGNHQKIEDWREQNSI